MSRMFHSSFLPSANTYCAWYQVLQGSRAKRYHLTLNFPIFKVGREKSKLIFIHSVMLIECEACRCENFVELITDIA